jgi:hypothetical protein
MGLMLILLFVSFLSFDSSMNWFLLSFSSMLSFLLTFTTTVIPGSVLLRYLLIRWRVYSPQARLTFDDSRVMTFTDQAIEIRTEGGYEARMPWIYVVRVVTYRGFTLLYLGPIVHSVIPDSAFSSTNDRAAFLSLASQHVKAPARRKLLG